MVGKVQRVLVIGLIMGVARVVFAGTPTVTVYGEEVVVTATRVEKGISEAPVSVSVITRDKIEERSQVIFVNDALRYESGVSQRQGKFADTMNRTTLRGFSGGQRTLVLLDGVPLNDAYNGGTYLGDLPVGNVQRIEVVKGPSSSLYGGEAMGGVINVITKTPEREEVEAKSSVSAFNTCHHILQLGNKMGRLRFAVNLEKRSSEGDRTDLVTKPITQGQTSTTQVTGWTKTTDSKGNSICLIGDKGKNYWDQNQYGCKFIYALSPASNLSLSFKGNSREYGYRDPQTRLVDTTGKPVDNGTVEFSGEGTATIAQKDFLGGWGVSKDNTYGFGYDTLLSGIALKGRLNFVDADSFSVDPQVLGASYSGGPGKLSKTSPRNTLFGEVQADIPLMENNLITAGLSCRNDSMRVCDWKMSNWRDESSILTPTGKAEGRTVSGGIYTQGEVQLLDTLRFFLGVRYDFWKNYDASSVDGTRSTKYADRDNAALSPRIGVVCKMKFEKGTYKLDSIRASWGKAFRPPTMYELYRTWTTSSGKTYAGNPELSCETTQSWELGIDQQLGRIALGITYFQSRIDDLIYGKLLAPKISVQENAGEGKIAGFEIDAGMKITGRLDAFANYTLQDTEITSNPADPKTVGKNFQLVPAKMANLGLSFHRNALDASCVWHFADKMYANSDNSDVIEGVYGAYDAVNTVDVKLGYAAGENLRLSLSVDNLLDREYYQNYKAAGRTAGFEVGYRY